MLFPRFPKSVNLANPMMGIPGVGASSGQGGFLSRGAGQQPGMLPITQTVLMQEAEKRRQSAQKLQEKAMQQMQEAAQLEAPQPRQAISQGEGIGGGILMLLLNALGTDRGEISDFAQNFLAARMQGANQQNEQDMRRYQMQANRMGDLANIDMTRAKLDMNEADSIQGRVDAERQRQAREREILRGREWDVADAEAKRAHDMNVQSQLTERAMIRDPAKVELYKAAGKRPDGRAWLAKISGYDTDAQEALRQLDADELLKQAKTETENAMRPARLKKMDADIQKVLGGIALDQERMRQIAQRIAMYPDEFKLRVASTYSLIEQRSRGKVGTGENYYYGKGDETALRAGLNSANQIIASMNLRTAGGPLSAEDAETLRVAEADAALFARELEKVKKAKTERVRKKYSGPGIDTSGGFAPMKVSPGDVQRENPFAGAKAKSGGKTRSGSSFTFEPD